ncbi:DUF4329 domain-containing protein [Dinoroseobacter sp. PD6]|uniref:DUF4329 domain-containing protein n=1 Tax=Dinoroseobacter sp. PD6 TaxID=3028384 RepID=UPI00237B8B0B|nr:DUF4329 domain-containing protein [Dinoroseobacter sp. PD6]MDD9716968.1 DUF4329 domain-containing protein [Dinoroseobacter sp. PD6]
MPRWSLTWVFALLAGPLAAESGPAPAAELAFVKGVLAALQARSFRWDREYCGYIGYTAEGELVASRARRGTADSCLPPWPRRFDPVASYHTHGGYDPEAWSEIPSDIDMASDAADGIDGYVATPGGRLWYIDGSERMARQICGVGCLPMDADFAPESDITVAESYSYEDLLGILSH